MSTVFSCMEQLIGNTPMLHLKRLAQQQACRAEIFAKLEFLNPSGSVKDRAALSMILDAERRGLLSSGSTIIEPTSGNTGIALACIAAARGYNLILTMPETMSQERRLLLAAFGARLILTPGALGMRGAVDEAAKLAAIIPNSFQPGQFENPANPEIHFRTTGPEIWRSLRGQVDALICCVGSGGTLSGAGRYLKKQNPSVEVIAVEPSASPLLSEGRVGPHALQGIGPNFIPDTLDRSVIDHIVTVSDEDAFAMGRTLARLEGLLVGISSGAAAHAACELARLPEYRRKRLAVILPDSGDRYLSSAMFA